MTGWGISPFLRWRVGVETHPIRNSRLTTPPLTDFDFWILSEQDVATLRGHNQIGTSESGVIITLSEPTARDETLALGSDSMREWLTRDEKVTLQDFAPLLAAELATKQVRRSRWWL